MPTDGPEQPNVVIRLSHSAPDTAYWRLYGKWLEQRPFDGVVMTIDPAMPSGMTKPTGQDSLTCGLVLWQMSPGRDE